MGQPQAIVYKSLISSLVHAPFLNYVFILLPLITTIWVNEDEDFVKNFNFNFVLFHSNLTEVVQVKKLISKFNFLSQSISYLIQFQSKWFLLFISTCESVADWLSALSLGSKGLEFNPPWGLRWWKC